MALYPWTALENPDPQTMHLRVKLVPATMKNHFLDDTKSEKLTWSILVPCNEYLHQVNLTISPWQSRTLPLCIPDQQYPRGHHWPKTSLDYALKLQNVKGWYFSVRYAIWKVILPCTEHKGSSLQLLRCYEWTLLTSFTVLQSHWRNQRTGHHGMGN